MKVKLYSPDEEEASTLAEWEEFYRFATQPVFGADFGADEDDEDEDEDEDDEDEDEDADDAVSKLAKDADDAKKNGKAKTKGKKSSSATSTSKYVPPSEAEYRKMVAALGKANQDQRARRQAALEKARAEGLSEGEATARADAEEQAKGKYHPMLIEYEAGIALRDAGCKNPARLVKLIDKNAVTIMENPKTGRYEMIGIEDQVNSLMDDWPELFGSGSDDDDEPPAPKPRGKSMDAGDRRPASRRQPKSSSEIALERLRGIAG